MTAALQPRPLTPVEECVEALTDASVALVRFADVITSVAEPQDVAALLLDVAEVRSLISGERGNDDAPGVYRITEQHLVALMGDAEKLMTPAGPFEKKRSVARTGWRWDDLIAAVVAKGIDERRIDPETGETLEREADAVARAIRDCVGFSAGKVKALRARGINPNAFCDAEGKGFGIQVPPKHKPEVA